MCRFISISNNAKEKSILPLLKCQEKCYIIVKIRTRYVYTVHIYDTSSRVGQVTCMREVG